MLKTHVSNWMSVLVVYKGMKKKTDAKFRDGAIIPLTREKYDKFYEYLYRKHLEAHGFSYRLDSNGNTVVSTPDGLEMVIPPVFSLVLDELYLMRIYGRPNLSGKVVVDVGAAIGDTPLYFSKLGANHVYAFEMDSERCKLARENIARNKMGDKITLFEGPARAERINSLNYDFIKIDCEGCENDLLPKLEFRGAVTLIMEYHGAPDALAETLRGKGLCPVIDIPNTIIRAESLTVQSMMRS